LLLPGRTDPAPEAAQPPEPKWKLVWSDEFDGPGIDRKKWDFDTGNGFYNYDANVWIGGWGNGELQYYTDRADNAYVKGGMLHIGSRWPGNTHVSREYVLPDGGTIADFHVYALEWEPGEMRWYVDGRRYATQNFWWSSSKVEGGKGARPTRKADLNPWPAPF